MKMTELLTLKVYPLTEIHIQMDLTTCYIEGQQQKYRLGTVSNRLLWWGFGGGLNMFNWILTLNL